MGQLTFRLAEPRDLATLQRWDEEPDVVASDPKDDWDWEAELPRRPPWREFWMAELHGRPVGFLQVIDAAEEETHYWGAAPAGLRAIDIWIGEADARGQGLGTEMMRFVIDRCFADATVHGILVDPLADNVRAHRFYERLGFQYVEDRWFGGDLCRVYSLGRSGWGGR